MPLEKAIVFRNTESRKLFFFLRLSTVPRNGGREIVMVGRDRQGEVVEYSPNVILGENSHWVYDGPRVYEG